ncbi:hypothetical protein B0H16DRAFT_1660998 [Mycena metata]|uniref:Uncharacterized protein n=1 Tax=Mycena metata TaxID=1033252 RepID=A0AAD7NNN8_9AGAR|nr:hypothetical protein B0H16DRAFT_1660998 [Mycena metata]
MQEQITRLSLLPNHSLFGQVSDELEDKIDPESTVDGAFAVTLRRMGINDNESDDAGEEEFHFSRPDEDEVWFPHGSRTAIFASSLPHWQCLFMLDLLDNLPRLRLSDDHLKAIIWVMRECKTPNVPSFSSLQKKQESLTREVGIKSEHHTSSLGNHFYMTILQSFWPWYFSGPVSEAWQADKWTTEADLDDLSPMWAHWEDKSWSHRHFYIKELVQLCDGTFAIPLCWITVQNVVYANVHMVESFEFNYLDLSSFLSIKLTGSSVVFSAPQYLFIDDIESSPHYPMPHPLRATARWRPMFRNVSKQYNAHTNMYVTNLNLPHQKLQQEYFIRFASTSPHVSSSEQFVALTQDCVPGTWHEAYDCELEQEILFEIIEHQSETSSHIGMMGNLRCRRDDAGGSKEDCETNEGYHAMYMVCSESSRAPGKPRDVDATVQIIRWEVWMACFANKSALEVSSTSTGVKDKISQHWISVLVEKAKAAHVEQISNKDTCNPQLNDPRCKGDERTALKTAIKTQIATDLWDWVVQQPNEFILLPVNDLLDPHRDTPVEILHTYLLGNDKYVWYDTTKTWDPKKGDKNGPIFASRLQSASISGLSIPPPRPRYVVQYKNSLIGKHFKMLQQLGVFYLHDLCAPLILDLWKATRELGAYLWFPEIKNMDVYIGKLHVLPHTPDDVRRFGPCIIFATKIFECWNAVFRLCSILSNHLAPSHDIATTLADMEHFKHMVSGGWWCNPTVEYIRAGSSVSSFLTSNRELQRRLGWSEKTALPCGTVKLETVKKREPTEWNLPVREPEPVGSTWLQCKYVSARTGDLCKPGFWVFVQMSGLPLPFPARIQIILARQGAPLTPGNAIVIVEPFIILDVKNPRLNMPLLVPSTDATLMAVNPEKDIMLLFNVQHDCVHCKCKADSVRVQQERTVTDRTELQLVHTPEQVFILNMHALHNAYLIREILPRALTAPIPYLQDRVASHHRFAAQLRETGPAKRAATQAKTQATKAKNKEGGEPNPSENYREIRYHMPLCVDPGTCSEGKNLCFSEGLWVTATLW